MKIKISINRLRTYITVSVQNKGLDIKPANVSSVPRVAIRLTVDIDYVYEEDHWYDVDPDLQQATEEEAPEFADCLEERRMMRTLFVHSLSNLFSLLFCNADL